VPPERIAEQRLTKLDSCMADLHFQSPDRTRNKDWRRTVGVFTDDPGMQSILRDAMRLREADRKKARAKKTGKRKPRS